MSKQFDSVAHRGFELRQPAAMPSHLDVAQPFDTVADVLDSWGQVETREPSEERFEFELDDLFGLSRFAFAIAQRSFNQRAEIVDVIQIDVRDVISSDSIPSAFNWRAVNSAILPAPISITVLSFNVSKIWPASATATELTETAP